MFTLLPLIGNPLNKDLTQPKDYYFIQYTPSWPRGTIGEAMTEKNICLTLDIVKKGLGGGEVANHNQT